MTGIIEIERTHPKTAVCHSTQALYHVRAFLRVSRISFCDDFYGSLTSHNETLVGVVSCIQRSEKVFSKFYRGFHITV